jgi:stage III sporulation protein AD
MQTFWQVIAGTLITVVLGLAMSKQGKDITLLLSVAGCCMALVVTVNYLKPVVQFVEQLKSVANLNGNMLKIMLKSVGIGLVAEIAAMICNDSGNSALSKAVQILAVAAVLWLSIPLMTELLELVEQIVGDV